MSTPPGTPSGKEAEIEPGQTWWLDPALARLAFGSRPPRRSRSAPTGAGLHLSLLSPESLEIDLDDPFQRSFGDYELLELIGQGGMGVVYRARQHSLEREVAVKLMSAGPWASPDFISRFQREAQAAARMQHPNIVPIHEIGSHDQFNFFSMRLVHGGSLASLLSHRGRLLPLEAARIVRGVSEAVDYAHTMGVLHLDLKPGNVLLDETGEPQVADFGLARRLDDTLGTHSSEVSGTPSYMAPEQALANAQGLSPATDIYGLGAILYECLCGQPPFADETAQDTLRKVVHEAPVALRRIDPSIAPDLEAICLKCLAKDPDTRYHSARALSDDLGRFLEGREVRARALHTGQRLMKLAQRKPGLTGLAAMLIFSLVLGFAISSIEWKRAEHNADAGRKLLWDGRREAALQLESDGKGLAALSRLVANLGEEGAAGDVAGAELDRRRIGMLLGQGATLIDRLLIADASPLALEISPNGRLLAIALNDRTVRWYDASNLEELGRVSLAHRSSSDGTERSVLLLGFAGDHRLLATMEWYGNVVSPGNGDSWMIDLDQAKVVEPPATFAHFADATYSADGRSALLRNGERRSQLWQVAPWRPLSALGGAQSDFLPWILDPRARFAARLTEAMQRVEFFDLPDLAQPRSIALPDNASISAWALSSDGDVLALGDFEGRVFLYDTVKRELRALPAARSREVTWISFSEDDAWLATADHDGILHAFDIATGDSVTATQMSEDFVVTRVGLSHGNRVLVAAGEGQTSIWRLPLPGPRGVSAQRVGLGPAPHALAGRYPVAWSLASGLLASAGMDGQIRLWRLPRAPWLPALAAPQVPERTFFQGDRLVDVEWDRLRLISPSGDASTAWLKFPQPPGFAELLRGGRLLAVTVGPELRLLDATRLQPIAQPIALAASPQRLLATADGSRILLAFGDTGPNGFEERLQLFDGRTGQRIPGEAILAGLQRRMAFSDDASRILVVGPNDGSTIVLDASGLKEIAAYPHDPYEPVIWADFESNTKRILMVTRSRDARLGTENLISWDPDSDEAGQMPLPEMTRPLAVAGTPVGAFVSGEGEDYLFPRAAGGQAMGRIARSQATAVVAVSPNRRVLARAFMREVQLFDVQSRSAIGLPLQGSSGALDMIMQLAFSSDGNQLLARTLQGHWLLWRIAAEPRPAKTLATGLSVLEIDRNHPQIIRLPSGAERSALRRNDPGPWRAPAPRPTPAASATTADGLSIPARAAMTSPLLVDLGAVYTVAPTAVLNSFHNVRHLLRPLPFGVQRLSGQDFDIRGMVQIGNPVIQAGRHTVRSIDCLPLPDVPVAALHALLAAGLRRPAETGAIFATLTLHYVDGSTALLPIRNGIEVRGHAGDDAAVPLVIAGNRAQTLTGLEDDMLSAPRLTNPHPTRMIRCLDLQVGQSQDSLVLLALTLEPQAASVMPSSR